MTAASGATRPASCCRSSADCSTAPPHAAAATPASRIRTRSASRSRLGRRSAQEQRELVESLTRSGDGVQVVRAAAGTGKTFALGAAVEAWQRSGIPVLGCGLSARAACELRDQTGIDTTTIARLTIGFEQGATLAPGSVLIVDEAGMVGTRDLAALARAAEDAQAKLVLVGDDRQLPEIQAGGAFRALADTLGALELREVRRQHEPWDRGALDALRRGDVETFAAAYEAQGGSSSPPTPTRPGRPWCGPGATPTPAATPP